MLNLLKGVGSAVFLGESSTTAVFRRFFFILLICVSGPAWAGEISILAPSRAETTILSRNKIAHVVVRVADAGDLDKINLYSENGGRSFNEEGRYEKDGKHYLHYSLPMKKGLNSFILGPVNLPLKIKFKPFGTLLNINFDGPNTYLFHRLEIIPADCAGCHDHKLAINPEKIRGGYGQTSTECYSCHQGTTLAAEWKHAPAAGLFCRACHDDDNGKTRVAIPTGKVEDVCFGCHINKVGWTGMKHIHGPVGTGDCTICHDPHGGNNPNQLWADGKGKLCVVCHEDKKKYLAETPRQKLRVHAILTARGCVVCHSPHATDYKFQLLAEINDLCASCHVALKGLDVGHPAATHPLTGVEDPLRPGVTLSCTSCHDPHGSDYDYLLIGDMRGGLVCSKCHAGTRKPRRFRG